MKKKPDFRKWANKYFRDPNKVLPKPMQGFGERPIKVMTNGDRRKLGIEQDPELPDYIPDENTNS